MNRRSFIASLGTLAAAASLGSKNLMASSKPQIAITMDDPRVVPAYGWSAAEVNRRILDALDKHKIHATLFVCGMRVDSTEGKQLLGTWNDAGHMLGNHSYSHPFLNSSKVTLASYCEDIARGESVVAGFPRFEKRFRYPFFKEGDTIEKRDGVRKFLSERGYKLGPATIDASDWAIDDRLTKRIAKDPKVDLALYRQFYLDHLWDRSQFYDDLAIKVLGHRPRHTILVHHRLLNALFLGDVLDMFHRRGWELISSEYAYADPIYGRQPKILPAGESIVWALAKESGKFDAVLRYPGEDDTYENPKMDKLGL
jgi:peptidoglycan/xylan/chitin deacetylase (PgdA/CDA1 family)